MVFNMIRYQVFVSSTYKFVHLPSYGQTDKKIILKYGQDTQGTFKLVAKIHQKQNNLWNN